MEKLLSPIDHSISSDTKSFLSQNGINKYVEEYFIKQKEVEIKKKFAMLCCQPMKVEHYKYQALYYSLLKKHGEKWTIYHMDEGDHPSDEELSTLNGNKSFVIF